MAQDSRVALAVFEDVVDGGSVEGSLCPGEDLFGRAALDSGLHLGSQRRQLAGQEGQEHFFGLSFDSPRGSSLGFGLLHPFFGERRHDSLQLRISRYGALHGSGIGLYPGVGRATEDRSPLRRPFCRNQWTRLKRIMFGAEKGWDVQGSRSGARDRRPTARTPASRSSFREWLAQGQSSKTASRVPASKIRSLQVSSCSGVAP